MGKYSALQLSDSIESEFKIYCSKCEAEAGEMYTDEMQFAEERFEEGWRATSQNTYCPECAKKYLKDP